MWCPTYIISALSPNYWHRQLLWTGTTLLTTHNSALPSLPKTELHLLKSVDIVANPGWRAAGNRRGRRGGRQISTSGIKHPNINLGYKTSKYQPQVWNIQISTLQISTSGIQHKYQLYKYQPKVSNIQLSDIKHSNTNPRYQPSYNVIIFRFLSDSSLIIIITCQSLHHSTTNAFWFCSRFWSWNHATFPKFISCVTPQCNV